MCPSPQPSPFHTDTVFSSNQTICTRQKPLLIPPQCQALVSVSALECPSSSPLLADLVGPATLESCPCSSRDF